jgi:hypothetical protein
MEWMVATGAMGGGAMMGDLGNPKRSALMTVDGDRS